MRAKLHRLRIYRRNTSRATLHRAVRPYLQRLLGADESPEFDLGNVHATEAAAQAARELGFPMEELVWMHWVGVNGAMRAADRRANELAVRFGLRVFSIYTLGNTTFWVITEGNRRKTLLMLAPQFG